jgi:hypothetical protein
LTDRCVELIEVKSPADNFAQLEGGCGSPRSSWWDGLFGIGLNRPLDPAWLKFITRINAAKLPVLAVDVPSGLNADTGETLARRSKRRSP